MAQSIGDIPPDISKLTVPKAARALGISPEAVRNRLSRGTLDSTKENGTVYVLLSSNMAQYTTDTPNDISLDIAKDPGAVSLLDAKNETIRVLREQLEAERAANRENRRLLAAALERIPALEEAPDTPPESPQSPETTSEGVGRPEEPPDTGRRSWWRRLFGA
jgi:hypothetical protein